MAYTKNKNNSDKTATVKVYNFFHRSILLEMPPSDETTFPELAYIQVFEHARSLIITDGAATWIYRHVGTVSVFM